MNNTTLFSTAFPHQAAELQSALPLLADAASRLYVDLIENEHIQLFVDAQSDYDILSYEPNWQRFKKLFGEEWPTATRITLTLRLPVNEQPELLPAAAPAAVAPPPHRQSARSNKLSLEQQMTLGEWMKQHRHEVENEPDTKLAAKAATDCAFAITTTNFSHVRTALKIEKTKPDVPPTPEERIKRLEMVVGTLITWLQSELGESPAIALLKMLAEHPAKLPETTAQAPEAPQA